MELLLLLLFAFVLVTVVGHGIWVGLAALARMLNADAPHRPPPARPAPHNGARCPKCGARLSDWDRDCPACGLERNRPTAVELRELEIASQQVRALCDRDEIDEAVMGQLVELFRARRRVLLGEPAARPAAAGLPPHEIETVRVPPIPVVLLSEKDEILDALPATVEPEPLRRGAKPAPVQASAIPAPPLIPAISPPPPPPRRVTNVLSAFMEERNILWGELVGGLLIVGCSIALVLTLWHSLQALPYFPFLLFSALTACLFAAGQYTLHHWKLQSTSRGLLLIAMLLAPLNLLVLADPSARGAGPDSPWVDLAVGALALLAFTGLVRASGRDLIGVDVLPGPVDRRWLLAVAVVGAAGSQLLTPHLLDAPAAAGGLPARFSALAGLPCAFYLLACGAVLAGLTLYGRRERIQVVHAHALFAFLGLATFSVLAAFAFLLSRLDRPPAGLHLLACPLILIGVPALAAGLLVFRRLEGDEIGGVRTTGTGVALAGLGLMLGGVALAWPTPGPLLGALLLAGGVLTAAAFLARVPWAHAAAVPCLTLAVLVAFFLATGQLPAENDPTRVLLQVLSSADSGAILAGVTVVLAALAAWLHRAGQMGHAVSLGWAGLVAAGTALVIVTGHGPDRPLTAAGVHGVCILAGVLSSLRWRSSVLAHVAGALLIPGTLWALSGLLPQEFALWGLVLAVETLALAITAAVLGESGPPLRGGSSSENSRLSEAGHGPSRLSEAGHGPSRLSEAGHSTSRLSEAGHSGGGLEPLPAAARRVALFTGALALLLAVVSGSFPHDVVHTFTTLTLSLALLVQAMHRRSEGWFTAFQAALMGTVLCAVAAFAYPRGWFADARGLQACAAGLGLLSLCWVAARRLMVDSPAQVLLPRSWPGLDRLALGGLVLWQLVYAGASALPGVAAEWAVKPAPGEWMHTHGLGAWLVLSVLAAALLAVLVGPPRQEAEKATPPPNPLPETERGSKTGSAPLSSQGRGWGRGCFLPRQEEQRLRELAILGLVLLAISATTLWAGLHAADRATVTALRWGLAGCFLAGSVLVWLRDLLARWAERVHLASAPATAEVRALMVATAGVVVFLSAILAGQGFSGAPVPGPAAESLFARMGSVVSSIVPLILVIVGLAGTAVRERSPGYALASGLLATATTMAGFALGVVRGGTIFDDRYAVLTVLIGCQTASAAALAWLAERRRIGMGPLLAVQSWLGLLGAVALAVVLLPGMLTGPGVPPEGRFGALGGPVGWLALIFSTGAAFWHASLAWPRRRVHVFGLMLLGAGIQGGSLARAWDTPTLWASYHVLAGFWGILAIALAAAGSIAPLRTRSWQVMLPARRVRPWLAGLAILLTGLALVGGFTSSAKPLTPIGAALAASVLTGAVALWFRQGGFVYSSGLQFALATFLAWTAWGPHTSGGGILSIVIGLALAAALWQAIASPGGQAKAFLPVDVAPMRWPGAPFSPIATAVALALLALVVAPAVAGDALGERGPAIGWMGWAAVVAVAVALAAALGDVGNRLARPGLYLLGLVLAGLVLHALRLSPARLAWAGALALATHAILVGLAAWWQSLSEGKAESGLRLPMLDREWPWLLPAQTVVAGMVVLLGFGVAVGPMTIVERLMGPLAIVLLAPAALVLARVAPRQWPERLRLTAAACGAAALAALAWAGPDPGGAVPWLQRNAWLLSALAVTSAVGLEGLARWPAGRRLGLTLGGLAVLLAPVVLGQMFPVFDKLTRRTPLGGPGVMAVALALAGLAALALRLALRPDRDPLNLSERGRTGYVYLAEVLVVLLFLHIRLNVPELFHGFLVRYWTLIVLLLAFLGVGLSELCERHGLRVLAAPLQRTGIFLPLIPILAFWARPPAALVGFADERAPGLRPMLAYLQARPWQFDWYALVWILAAALYGVVATARRSLGWAVAAALAANFGLWALFMHVGVGFLVHPQAWVIPLGVIVLASEYLNRDRLAAEAAQALRYLGISLIYVASTADLFLAGLGNSVWLPVVLAVLCVAGVLAGILLRVRAFLFLGVGFLLVDLFTMIWYAAVDRAQTWLWWACGIVLGAAILALFAVFEKRRNDVLELLDGLRKWE